MIEQLDEPMIEEVDEPLIDEVDEPSISIEAEDDSGNGDAFHKELSIRLKVLTSTTTKISTIQKKCVFTRTS